MFLVIFRRFGRWWRTGRLELWPALQTCRRLKQCGVPHLLRGATQSIEREVPLDPVWVAWMKAQAAYRQCTGPAA